MIAQYETPVDDTYFLRIRAIANVAQIVLSDCFATPFGHEIHIPMTNRKQYWFSVEPLHFFHLLCNRGESRRISGCVHFKSFNSTISASSHIGAERWHSAALRTPLGELRGARRVVARVDVPFFNG